MSFTQETQSIRRVVTRVPSVNSSVKEVSNNGSDLSRSKFLTWNSYMG